MTIKTEGWVVVAVGTDKWNRGKEWICTSNHPVKQEAINEVTDRLNSSWDHLYGKGYRAVRATLTVND